MQFPNLNWAVARCGPRYRFAAAIGESESWLSRRLTGRVEFTPAERVRVAEALGYPADWLFSRPNPPSRGNGVQLEQAGVAA
jgi:transcriptional regulator with XRE-family HTH domain